MPNVHTVKYYICGIFSFSLLKYYLFTYLFYFIIYCTVTFNAFVNAGHQKG